MANLAELIAAHRAAIAEYDACDDDNWDARKDEINTLIEKSTRALLDHRPLSTSEVFTKAEYMATAKAFVEWDDVDVAGVIRALTPTRSPIETLITAHKAAWDALDAACEVTDNATGADARATAELVQDKASEATGDAMDAIIEHPYPSLDELKLGMAYIIKHHRSTGDGNLEDWLTDLTCNVAGIEDDGGAA